MKPLPMGRISASSCPQQRICLLQSCDGASLGIMRMHNGPTASELLCDRRELKHLPPEDFARLDYGRLLWKNPLARARLIAHWTDSRHPYRERFAKHRPLIEAILSAPVEQLDDVVLRHGSSLRASLREIPPVFGQFWRDSLSAAETGS